MQPSAASDHASLLSIADSVDDLSRRVTVIADQYVGSTAEDVAAALYEIERNLRTARRRLERVTDRIAASR